LEYGSCRNCTACANMPARCISKGILT
jgi:hypothetical protein